MNQQLEPIKMTAFLDLLGYSEINKNIKNKGEAQNLFSKFNLLKQCNITFEEFFSKNRLLGDENPTFQELYDLNVIFISDSIIISLMPKENYTTDLDLTFVNGQIFIYFSFFIAQLQIICINEFRHFLRGGITDKFSCMHENMAAGEGVIAAYNLESKNAIYPRVIFEKTMLEKYNISQHIKEIDKMFMNSASFFSTNENEAYGYINYFNTFPISSEGIESEATMQLRIKSCSDFILLHCRLVEKFLLKETNEKVQKKYEWLNRFQYENFNNIIKNPFIREYLRMTNNGNRLMNDTIIYMENKKHFFRNYLYKIIDKLNKPMKLAYLDDLKLKEQKKYEL